MFTAVRPVAPKPRRKERVPAHGERPMMGLSSNRNFITCNALEVIRARPPPTDVQEYSYVCKPDFGCVPTYLTAARQRLQREKEEQDVAAAEAARQVSLNWHFFCNSCISSLFGHQLSDIVPLQYFSSWQWTVEWAQDAEARGVAMSKEERAELLALLKGKWGVLNAAFQRLPMTLDTPSKRRRKEVLEAQLAQTEHDIQLLQNAVTVLIRNDLHQNSYT